MRTTEQQISNSLITERLIASLSAVFGFLATLLATIGLYGVMAYTVARRTREIGIRMALGAVQGNVIWMVMREVLVLVAIGVAVGVTRGAGLTGWCGPAVRPDAARSGDAVVIAARLASRGRLRGGLYSGVASQPDRSDRWLCGMSRSVYPDSLSLKADI